MAHNIIIGRSLQDAKKLGMRGLIFIGKNYVKMGQTTSLSSNIYLDVNNAHVILISGKRGSGKSYTLSVIAEEVTRLSDDVKKNLSVLILDTMGIFWSMKYPNLKQEGLLKDYNLKPTGLDVNVYTPKGKFDEYKKKNIPTDFNFSIKPSELDAGDWCNVFNISLMDDKGVLIERVMGGLEGDYDIKDIIKWIGKDKKSAINVKNAVENRFRAAELWGLFDKEGTKIKDIVKEGEVSILDVSCYTDWNIKTLVIGILGKKLLQERMDIRKIEEMESIEEGQHYFDLDKKKKGMPLVWIMIDEAHEFLPKVGRTPASDALIQILREGRQPGISLVLATQQPGEIARDVMTQSDIVISHRVTARLDIEALNSIMQTYLTGDILSYLNNLPRLKGSAIILDDNSERIYPMRTRPKLSWHGGDAPSAVRIKKNILDLGI
ncbi:MAG: ATP-binding protein [Nanoarchaeota archaeon]|nr:ATP-binding protein [Nanoarchaeota archaeon]